MSETSAEQTETEMWKDEPMSMLLKIQDQLTSLRSLVELQEQMREVQGGLQSLRSAVAAQGNQLQQVQALMKASHVTSVDALAAPDSEPPMLPGEIVMEMSPKLLHHKKSATVQSRSPGLGGGIAALNKPRIMSMDQIEAHTAHVLLAPKALTHSRSAQSSKSRHEDEELEDFGEEPNDQPVRTFTSRQLTTNPNIVLQSCRRMSLDDLRTNHDAILAATTAQHTITRQSGFFVATDSRRSVLPRVANFWLTVLGIWDLEQVRSGCVLFAISFILLALSALVLYLSSAGLCDPYISATTLCYLVGVLAAAWRLRWSQIHGMLSREDGGLEDYARSSGFLDDWRSTSKRRFKEVLGFLFVMLCCRWLAYASDSFVDTGHPESPVTCGCFSVVALFFTAIVYIHLHIVAGMELAIDSFSINFYKEMDMELALGEWNTVQATLRQLSTKLSTSMLLLGSSCGASLLLLVQLTVFEQEEGLKAGLPFLAFSSWLFPPVLLFLYAMMRAAGVTEKASRVPPLVNSWTFDNDDDDDHPAWMDQGRQYIVQYMIQSEAGFYLQGVRLHVFQVTKLCYYFAAFIFALFSQSWA